MGSDACHILSPTLSLSVIPAAFPRQATPVPAEFDAAWMGPFWKASPIKSPPKPLRWQGVWKEGDEGENELEEREKGAAVIK